MEFLTEYGLFLLKTITIVVAITMLIGFIAGATRKQRSSTKGDFKVVDLGEQYKDNTQAIKGEIISDAEFKALVKEEKKSDKAQAKADKKQVKQSQKSEKKAENNQQSSGAVTEEEESSDEKIKPKIFVLDFEGDVEASGVAGLREEISAILSTAKKEDSFIVRLESPGGMVHSYGLASSQLQRIKQAGHHLTIAVDEVAASGGYMMACVADSIVAAPFSIIGSIGVVAEVPNFNRLLKKAHVDYEQHTAGDYKRTLTMFGENTSHGRDKFKEELADTHQLFKAFIKENRPSLDVDKVATGEHWYGSQAIELGLVDAIKTSDDLVIESLKEHDVYSVKYEIRKPMSERLSLGVQSTLEKLASKLLHRSGNSSLFK